MGRYSIYAIREAASQEFRYVGQTRQLPEARLHNHISYALRNIDYPCETSPFSIWLRDSIIHMEVLALAETRETAKDVEKKFIEDFSSMGFRLFNKHHVPTIYRLEDGKINLTTRMRAHIASIAKGKVVE